MGCKKSDDGGNSVVGNETVENDVIEREMGRCEDVFHGLGGVGFAVGKAVNAIEQGAAFTAAFQDVVKVRPMNIEKRGGSPETPPLAAEAFPVVRQRVRFPCWHYGRAVVGFPLPVAGYGRRFTEYDKPIKTFLSFVKNISLRLSEAIKASGKSKGALAAHLGVPQSSVSRWLAGGEPRSERLSEIAKFLGVDVKWLMSADIAESSANPKEPGIGESAHAAYAVHDDVTPYRVNVDPVAAAFAKIREGLDLLEQLMKNPKP